MKLPTVSVVLIVKNEAHNIPDYFKTIDGLADELVVVDSGSTDGTLQEIDRCKKEVTFPVHVVDMSHVIFHDSKNRQIGADHATSDYVLEVDTDERLSEAYKTEFKPFLRDKNPEVVTMPRIDELVPHLHDILDYRCFRKGADAKYDESIARVAHPKLLYSAKPVYFDHPIYHLQGVNHWLRRPQRIFGQLVPEINTIENIDGFWRELARGILGMFYKFRKVYFRLGTRHDGWLGFKFALLKGLSDFLLHLFIGLKPRKGQSLPPRV